MRISEYVGRCDDKYGPSSVYIRQSVQRVEIVERTRSLLKYLSVMLPKPPRASADMIRPVKLVKLRGSQYNLGRGVNTGN